MAPAYHEAQSKLILLDHLAWARAHFDSRNAVLADAIKRLRESPAA